jgi:regulatory protein
MPIITKIVEQKRRSNRRSVYLDGRFAFGCNVNVVARFRLVEGQTLSADQIEAIQNGAVRQECFDHAIKSLERRLHTRAELSTKLKKQEYPMSVIESVLDQLTEMNYVNDQRFAETRAEQTATYKHHGRNRAMMELAKKGVARETARQAVEKVYESHDSAAMARELVRKKYRILQRLGPVIARRRLYGMLLRRGFDFDTIKPAVEEVIAADPNEDVV